MIICNYFSLLIMKKAVLTFYRNKKIHKEHEMLMKTKSKNIKNFKVDF